MESGYSRERAQHLQRLRGGRWREQNAFGMQKTTGLGGGGKMRLEPWPGLRRLDYDARPKGLLVVWRVQETLASFQK